MENFIRDAAFIIIFLTSWFNESMTAELKKFFLSSSSNTDALGSWVGSGVINETQMSTFLPNRANDQELETGFAPRDELSLITLCPQCFSIFQLIVLVLTAGNSIILEVSPLS